MQRYQFPRAGWLASVIVLTACGGGGSTSSPSVSLLAVLTSEGSYLKCDASTPDSFTLERQRGPQVSSETISCPSTRVLAGDFELSTWNVVRVDAATGSRTVVATAPTQLPKPAILQDGARLLVVPTVPVAVSATLPLKLTALSATGSVLASYADPSALTVAQLPPSAVAQWAWSVSTTTGAYTSAPAPAVSFAETDLGLWGALSYGDMNGDGRTELLGTLATDAGVQVQGLGAQGLGALSSGRDFRDVRLADLNNDGRLDVVSNVYGTGCALMGLQQADGSYALSTPLRRDGSCIGGYGETAVVADFDGDGLVDVLLPSYERFDFLHNLGDGRFEEIAEDLGISFPNYTPHVEGATAVDINLDGAVDVVIASEVLLNDGHGHFTPLSNPFGPSRVHDEGMSVADIDGDGVFDIVKNDPSLGPRIFWGAPDQASYADSGWMLGGAPILSGSYGIAVGDLTGNGLADIMMAGGEPAGRPPALCAQLRARQFDCLFQAFPAHDGAWQDLLLATDLNGDGAIDLASRFGTIRTFMNSSPRRYVFRIDVRDAQGHANQFGRALRATCAVDGSLLGLGFVDGGNGYMAQGPYAVTFSSDWCPAIRLEVPTRGGSASFGPLDPGTEEIRLANT